MFRQHRREARIALLVVACAAAMGLAGCANPGAPSGQPAAPAPAASPAAPAATSGSQAATAASAGLTVGATEGPYYITGTAELKNGDLNAGKLPGEPIKVSGHVYAGPDSSKPLAGAKVEIWHADSSGTYHPNSNGDASQYSASQLALRGYVLADKDGYYEFTSVYPGYYPGRTRHIHVRASAAGYGGVTTQIIVPSKPGDGTTPQTDMIAQSLPASYQVTFTDQGGVKAATFDFHLGAD